MGIQEAKKSVLARIMAQGDSDYYKVRDLAADNDRLTADNAQLRHDLNAALAAAGDLAEAKVEVERLKGELRKFHNAVAHITADPKGSFTFGNEWSMIAPLPFGEEWSVINSIDLYCERVVVKCERDRFKAALEQIEAESGSSGGDMWKIHATASDTLAAP